MSRPGYPSNTVRIRVLYSTVLSYTLPAVTLGGAALFLIFGVIYLFEALAGSAEDLPISIASDLAI